MASGWLRGTVVEVPSGDTVVIGGGKPGGPTKRVTLSSLLAPRLVRSRLFAQRPRWCGSMQHYYCLGGLQGRRDGSTADENFAWASREWLRKKLIGQVST